MCERGILPVSPSSNSTVIRSPSSSRPSKPVGGGVGSGGRSGAETSWEAAPEQVHEGGYAAGRTWASEPGSPGSTGSQSGRARGHVHSSRDPPQINEGWGWGHPSPIPERWTLSPEP